jgi:hypothetical protein
MGSQSVGASFVQQATLEETPSSSIMEIEVAVGASVFAWKVLAISSRNQSFELGIVELIKLLGSD